ncbi:hypothetical protein [Aureispira anguillae]|uniref:Uncharacterized protein n=1 Tax=Aureispira anguillae TaxID=2864201 RepID=A0A915VK56_9BACT|nr:hypothetical protein [Aureispira anguillae]BDS09499.1 hypothetical protein AsAng_0002000 [Aureispira anguillae]
MLKKLNWEAYSGANRMVIIEHIKELIDTHHGCIIHFNRFSDLALSLSIEVPENQIAALHKKFQHILQISELDTSNIDLSTEREWLIFMHLSFSKGKGNAKLDIPNVPG